MALSWPERVAARVRLGQTGWDAPNRLISRPARRPPLSPSDGVSSGTLSTGLVGGRWPRGPETARQRLLAVGSRPGRTAVSKPACMQRGRGVGESFRPRGRRPPTAPPAALPFSHSPTTSIVSRAHTPSPPFLRGASQPWQPSPPSRCACRSPSTPLAGVLLTDHRAPSLVRLTSLIRAPANRAYVQGQSAQADAWASPPADPIVPVPGYPGIAGDESAARPAAVASGVGREPTAS